jgi:hypothetical protein
LKIIKLKALKVAIPKDQQKTILDTLLMKAVRKNYSSFAFQLLSDEHRPRPYISKGLYEFVGIVFGEYWMDNGDFFICVEPAGPPPGCSCNKFNRTIPLIVTAFKY